MQKNAWSILAGVGDGVFVIGRDVQYPYVNSAFEEMSGYSSAELSEIKSTSFYQTKNDPNQLADMRLKLQKEKAWNGELITSGKRIPVCIQLTIAQWRSK